MLLKNSVYANNLFSKRTINEPHFSSVLMFGLKGTPN